MSGLNKLNYRRGLKEEKKTQAGAKSLGAHRETVSVHSAEEMEVQSDLWPCELKGHVASLSIKGC